MSLIGSNSSTKILGRSFVQTSAARPFTLTGWFRWPIATNGTPFFHSALVNIGNQTTYTGLLFYYSSTGPTFGTVCDEKDSAGTETYVFNYYGTGTTSPPSTQAIANGVWYFGAVVYYSLSYRFAYTSQLPAGLAQDTNLANSSTNIASTYDHLVIGGVPWLGDLATSATHMAEAAIWNSSLSLAELQILARNASPLSLNPGAGLLSYYPMRGNLKDYGPAGIGLGDIGTTAYPLVYADHPPVPYPQDKSYLVYRYTGTTYTPTVAAFEGTYDQAAVDVTRALLAAAKQATQGLALAGQSRGAAAGSVTGSEAAVKVAGARQSAAVGGLGTIGADFAAQRRASELVSLSGTEVMAQAGERRGVAAAAQTPTQAAPHPVATRAPLSAGRTPTTASTAATKGNLISTAIGAVTGSIGLTTAAVRRGAGLNVSQATAGVGAAARIRALRLTAAEATLGALAPYARRSPAASARSPTVGAGAAGATRRAASASSTRSLVGAAIARGNVISIRAVAWTASLAIAFIIHISGGVGETVTFAATIDTVSFAATTDFAPFAATIDQVSFR